MRFLLFVAFSLSATAQGAERITAFHSDIRIAASGELTVVETIEVQAEGKEIRRGILREFPTDYRGRSGTRVTVPFDVDKVTRNRKPEPYALERAGNGVRVRIGDAAVTLPHGKHVYEITYRTARQIGFFDKHDELYWNVNGNGWTFAFERLTAEVTFHQPVPAAELRVEAYTGPQGARGTDFNAFVRQGSVAFRASRPLAPREGMTIVVGFPKGLVAEPSAAVRGWWMASANPGVSLGAAGFVLLVAVLGWRWLAVGIDPRAGPRFPRYEPPSGLGPAAVRYLDTMGFDDRCFAAALLGLGSRGVVKIRQTGERYRIERTGKTPPDWYPGEQALLQRLLEHQAKHIDLEKKKYEPAVGAAQAALRGTVEAHFGEGFFTRNARSLAAGIGIAFLTLLLAALYNAPGLFLLGLGAAMAAAVLGFAYLLRAYSERGRRLQDEIEGLRQYLSVAEKDDLARMKAPPQTAEEFSRFLPYAMALDVEKAWAERFTAILGAAAVAAAVNQYYQSGNEDGTGLENLSDSLSGMSDTIASASEPPGSASGFSSDSGGGGSSGGGGGGGGGSGW